jgi:hypothetical protein
MADDPPVIRANLSKAVRGGRLVMISQSGTNQWEVSLAGGLEGFDQFGGKWITRLPRRES